MAKNRSLAAKAVKAKRQRIELGKIEASKPLNHVHTTIAAANAKRDEVNALIAYGFNGSVVTCPKGPAVQPVGKGRREFDKRTYGNFKPRLGSRLTPDVYATAATLIRAGQVIGQA